MLKIDDKTIVYHDPITLTEPEGSATLKEQIRPDTGDGLSMWMVEFDDEPGELFQRTIKEL